jgi:hypothetical protein
LSDKRQLVVILRLVIASSGQLLYGEVVDVDAGPKGRFVGWPGLTAAVRARLTRELDPMIGSATALERNERDPRPIEH